MHRLALAVLVPLALAFPRVASAQDTIVVQYAAKLLCGVSNRAGVAPGRYFTAVNVHNPARDSVLFRYKFALTRPNVQPGPITPWTGAVLLRDQALEIECTDSLIRLGRGFAKGFVVVETQRELDVVGVYTAVSTTTRVQTMAIDRVPPRRTILLP
ncbi:MAG: hypothetical protein DMD29_06390 [Gemmatimonadetes bacterium]|nr:MAG: hypothetical protein DMD29_06390 [Gemmatimonadota bacterium]